MGGPTTTVVIYKAGLKPEAQDGTPPPPPERPTDWFQLSVILTGLICMGAGLGFERSLLPRMAVTTFHHQSVSTVLNFVASFGLSKAVANIFAGPIADKFGRKITLVVGFLVGLPVMPYIIFAQSWNGITLMNVMFGFSQGLLGSALFFLLIDVLGPSRRGIAVGIGECTIYVSTAILNVVAGDLASRFGFRPVPFYVATGFSILGLLSTIPLQDTLDIVKQEQSEHESARSRLSAQSSFGAELRVRRDSDSSSSSGIEGNVFPSRAAFPFDSAANGNEVKDNGDLAYHKEEERIRHYIGQESGFSTDSDAIAGRPTLPFASSDHPSDATNEPQWKVRERSSDGRTAVQNVDRSEAGMASTVQTTGASLPLVDDAVRKGPPIASSPTVPYGSTDTAEGPSSSDDPLKPNVLPLHHRTKTPLEEYKAFETRIEDQFEKYAPKSVLSSIRMDPIEDGASSEHRQSAFVSSLRFHAPFSGKDGEKSALLSKGQDRMRASFDSSDEDEEEPNIYDTFKKSQELEQTMGPDPPLKALWKLILNKNFSVICLCGMIMNFKDGFAWGSFPVFFSEFHNLSDDHTDMLVALYPLCWGFAQAFTGALSDLYGRRLFLIVGIGSCTVAIALFAVPGVIWGRPANDNELHVTVWAIADVLLGLGTACAYPALQAGAADEIDPVNRGIGLGFYRFIRDMGYVVGALVCGRITDAVGGEIGYMVTFLLVAAIMLSSLLLVLFVYRPQHCKYICQLLYAHTWCYACSLPNLPPTSFFASLTALGCLQGASANGRFHEYLYGHHQDCCERLEQCINQMLQENDGICCTTLFL